MLEGRGLAYSAGGMRIFAGVDLAVAPGQSLAVTGPSGSGKTSLLAVLSGLATPTEGVVLIEAQPLTGFAGPARGVAVVLQGYGLVSLLTAAENVEVALRAAGRPSRSARSDALAALDQLGLLPQAHLLTHERSGGQQQRTAVARALALAPRLLIADEPTAELDPAARALALAQILGLVASGSALVLATHDPEVAERCDHVLDLGVPNAPMPTAVASGHDAAAHG
jgi:ABC-type lipoprotein export system ATPase subunit